MPPPPPPAAPTVSSSETQVPSAETPVSSSVTQSSSTKSEQQSVAQLPEHLTRAPMTSSGGKAGKSKAPLSCTTCGEVGHEWPECDGKCCFCGEKSHKRQACPLALPLYPQDQRIANEQKVIRNLEQRIAEKSRDVKSADKRATQLETLTQLGRTGKWVPSMPQDPMAMEGVVSDSPVVKPKLKEQPSLKVKGPRKDDRGAAIRLFGDSAREWKDCVPGWLDYSDVERCKLKQTMNGQARGEIAWSVDLILQQALQAANRWPPADLPLPDQVLASKTKQQDEAEVCGDEGEIDFDETGPTFNPSEPGSKAEGAS